MICCVYWRININRNFLDFNEFQIKFCILRFEETHFKSSCWNYILDIRMITFQSLLYIYIYIFFLLNDHNINIFWMIHFFPIKIMSKFVVFITIIHQTAKNCCRKNITKPQIFTKPVKIKSLPKNQNVKKSNYVISNVISTQKSSRHQ